MKKITTEQIKQVMSTFYQTNITAKDFDSVTKFFDALPAIEEITPETKSTESND